MKPHRKLLFAAVTLVTIFALTVMLSQSELIKNKISQGKKTTTEQSTPSTSPAHQETPATSSAALELTEEEMRSYKLAYKHPAVLFLREAIDAYRTDSYTNETIALIATRSAETESARHGLASFEEYLDSKFIVYSLNESIAGGINIHIIFLDKPDRIFTAWVYEKADQSYDLRGFWEQELDPNAVRQLVEEVEPILAEEGTSI